MEDVGTIRMAGWLLGGVTWQRVKGDERLYADYIRLGVDWFGDDENHELALPQQVVWVEANPAIMRAARRQLILGDYLRLTGTVAMVWQFDSAADVRQFDALARKRRRLLVQILMNGLPAEVFTGDRRKIWLAGQRLGGQLAAGTMQYDAFIARLEALLATDGQLATRWAAIRRRMADARLVEQAKLQQYGHQRFVLVPTQAKLLTQAQIIINPPAMPRESIRDGVFQHDWLVKVEAARRDWLASGRPLITKSRRPIAGGEVWQSDGRLVPRNKE